MRVRNFLYDKGWFRSLKFAPAIINCGNLSVGGTGKSPHTEYIVQLLIDHHKVGILSRGYGRKTKGYRLVTNSENALTVGDEPWQYHTRFNEVDVTIAVAERRAEGIPLMLLEKPELNTIVLDDAFQHRRVSPSQNLLITTFQNPFWRDHVLPSGWLRESRSGAKRADALILSKCPEDLTEAEVKRLKNEARKYLRVDVPIFFSSIVYRQIRPVILEDFTPIPKFIGGHSFGAFCGIASPDLFRKQVIKTIGTEVALKSFIPLKDHATIDAILLDQLMKITEKEGITAWICTAKDRTKLLHPNLANHPFLAICWYVPISVKFLDQYSAIHFDNWLINAVDITIAENGLAPSGID